MKIMEDHTWAIIADRRAACIARNKRVCEMDKSFLKVKGVIFTASTHPSSRSYLTLCDCHEQMGRSSRKIRGVIITTTCCMILGHKMASVWLTRDSLHKNHRSVSDVIFFLPKHVSQNWDIAVGSGCDG